MCHNAPVTGVNIPYTDNIIAIKFIIIEIVILKVIVFIVKWESFFRYIIFSILSLNKIKKQFSNDKEWLKEKYKIKNIYLFGSYQKKMARIDSDIDLLIIFDEGNSYERKKEIIDELNEYYKNVFHRFIDIGQLSSLVSDSFIKESNKLIKII